MSNSRFSLALVWLVPVVAIGAAVWLLAREYRTKGPTIHLHFADGAGIEAGKTPLMHKGVAVGLVDEVALTPKMDGVRVSVTLDASAKPLAVQGSNFWLVHPEIGLSGVRGLDTLLSGARIHVRAGQGAPATHFTALPKPPPEGGSRPGRTFTLRSDTLGGLHPGTAVYYRDVKVGVIEDHRLAADSTYVLIDFKLFSPYYQLVRDQTVFWNSGGLSMNISLLGAKVRSNSLESLVSGGVSFATPETAAHHPLAAEGTVFEFHPQGEKEWVKWRPSIPLGEASTP